MPLHFEGQEHFSESPEDVDRAFRAAGLLDCLRWPEAGKAMRVGGDGLTQEPLPGGGHVTPLLGAREIFEALPSGEEPRSRAAAADSWLAGRTTPWHRLHEAASR